MAAEGMVEGLSIKMQGIISENPEGNGWMANMSHPNALPGVELPLDALCATRDYPNEGARTRITKLHCPDLPVQSGDIVVAQVATITELTGEMVKNPAYHWDDYAPRYIPKLKTVGASVVRWGIKSQ